MWSEWDYTERDGGEIVLQTTVSGMGNSSDSSASGSRCSGGVGASASGEQKMDVEVETLRKIEDIAGSKFRDGRYSEALQLLLVARPTRERVNGEDGPATLQTLSNLGTLYCAMGKFGEAEAVLARVHEAQLHRSGEHAFDTLRTGTLLAVAKKHLMRLREAEILLRRAFRGLRILATDASSVAIAAAAAATAAATAASTEAASHGAVSDETLRWRAAAFGFADAAYHLGVLYVQQGKRVAAHHFFRCAARQMAAVLGEQHLRAQDALQWERRCHAAVLRSAEAGAASAFKGQSQLPTDAAASVIAEGDESSTIQVATDSADKSKHDKSIIDSSSSSSNSNRNSSNSNTTNSSSSSSGSGSSNSKLMCECGEEPSEGAVQAEQPYRSKLDWRSSGCCGLCGESYGFILREHHCRLCSRSVCAYCCEGKALVAEFDVARPVKVCSTCTRQGF